MIKNIEWWHVETVVDIGVLAIALATQNWGFCAMYFAVGYFGHRAVSYLEKN